MQKQFEKGTPGFDLVRGFALRDRLPLQLRLDVLDVVFDLRPAARIMARVEGEVEGLCRELLELRCFISVGKGVRWQRKSHGIACHDWFEDHGPDDKLEAMTLLYIGRTETSSIRAREADETRDDNVFARALGYPQCCIDWVAGRRRVPELAECFDLYTRDGLYDPLLWPGAMALDAQLTPHYPCSVECADSLKITRARLELLKELECAPVIRRIQDARSVCYVMDAAGRVTAPVAAESLAGVRLARPAFPAAQRLNLVP